MKLLQFFLAAIMLESARIVIPQGLFRQAIMASDHVQETSRQLQLAYESSTALYRNLLELYEIERMRGR